MRAAGARGITRAKGGGVIANRHRLKEPYEVFAPGNKRMPGAFIGAFDTLHAATRALNAWWTVQALLALLGTQAQAETRAAS